MQDWLSKHYHASMGWIEKKRKEREDLKFYFPEVQSIVSVAVNYFTGRVPESKEIGKISNYAWGDDYHKILKDKLYKLLLVVQNEFRDVKYRICVDTSPVMDKLLARNSGLGWIGKHTNLITKEFGSWIFLGELMLDCRLDYDVPFDSDHFGTCTACLDACPTNAFSAPYVLDSNKCISYLTIEHRGSLPENIKTNTGSWIYGCDICQQVCPWNNKFEKSTIEKLFAPRTEIQNRSLQFWSERDEEKYRNLFKGSPVKRTKYKGLMRNVSNAIKNSVEDTMGHLK